MIIIKPSAQIISNIDYDYIIKLLERAGRTCYKSENKITEKSAEDFLKHIIANGHEAVLEHFSFTVKFVCDRGVSHETVRHRIASFCQESTRYCNYGKENQIKVIEPMFFEKGTEEYKAWYRACCCAEESYLLLLQKGRTPQEARTVLPNSLATELVMTANIREWRHFLKLRTSPAAHPQMVQIAKMLLNECVSEMPVLFKDLKQQ